MPLLPPAGPGHPAPTGGELREPGPGLRGVSPLPLPGPRVAPGRPAQAAECAREQDAFWPYHDLLFQSQRGENQGTFRRQLFLALAGPLGLDEGAFVACLDGEAAALRVRADLAEVERLGLRGTPTLRVGDEMLYGLPRWPALAELVESKLR